MEYVISLVCSINNCSLVFLSSQNVLGVSFAIVWPEEGVCTSGVPSVLLSFVVGVMESSRKER